MNKIVLSGNIVKDIEFKHTKNGAYYVRNRIAVKDNWNTEYEKTYFIDFETYNMECLSLLEELKKGALIQVEGKLVVESYKDDEGQWHNITKVVVFKLDEIKYEKKQDVKAPTKKFTPKKK